MRSINLTVIQTRKRRIGKRDADGNIAKIEGGLYLDRMVNKLVRRNNGTVSGWERRCSGNFVILATQTLACGLGKSRTVSAGNHSANQSNSTFIRLEGDFKTCHFLLEEVASLVTPCRKHLANKDKGPAQRVNFGLDGMTALKSHKVDSLSMYVS